MNQLSFPYMHKARGMISCYFSTLHLSNTYTLDERDEVTIVSNQKTHFKMAFYRLFYVRLGDCPTGVGNWPRRVRAPRRG